MADLNTGPRAGVSTISRCWTGKEDDDDHRRRAGRSRGGSGVEPFPASASAQPALPDYPDVDEAFAVEYARTYAREICSTIDYRLAQIRPYDDRHPVELIIEDVRAQGGFPNYETAGFAIGFPIGSSCPQHLGVFEEAIQGASDTIR